MMTVIGTCSLCGGAVTAPDAWHSVTPYVPECSACGATAAAHGPVIPMRAPTCAPSVFGTGSAGSEWRVGLTTLGPGVNGYAAPGLTVGTDTVTVTPGHYATQHEFTTALDRALNEGDDR